MYENMSMQKVENKMEIHTASGVKMLIANGEAGKLVAFDRPVATVELTYDEARRLGYALGKEKQAKLSKGIQQLMEAGYFQDPRSFTDIRERLQMAGLRVKSASLHVLVTNLVERGLLTRHGSRRCFTYVAPVVAKVT